MPQLIGLALLGAGIYAGVRAAIRFGQRISEEARRTDDAEAATAVAEKDLGSLEFDPASGVYKPAGRS